MGLGIDLRAGWSIEHLKHSFLSSAPEGPSQFPNTRVAIFGSALLPEHKRCSTEMQEKFPLSSFRTRWKFMQKASINCLSNMIGHHLWPIIFDKILKKITELTKRLENVLIFVYWVSRLNKRENLDILQNQLSCLLIGVQMKICILWTEYIFILNN